ncbi:MAG TPA: hypothetical protein VGQ41_20515 [Pyrinomonadaceae bacterium]|nr:hypothetical protein [Pyrinomonadaceae bacterium]
MRLLVSILMAVLVASNGLEKPVSSATSPQITSDHPSVSLLRSDAVLVPFAQYSHGRWENPWAKSPDSTAEEPNTLADLSKPWFAEGRLPSPLWHFWSPRGKALLLNASQVVEVESHCQKLWGVISDLPKEEAVDDHFGLLGIALNIDRKVNPSYKLDKTQDEWTKLNTLIQSEFDKEEQAKEKQLREFLPLPRREETKNKSVTLSYLYRMTIEKTGERLYYFEALKEYRKPIPINEQTCNNVFLNGWILTKSDELKLIDSTIGWKDCETGVDSIPLGLLVLDDEVFIFSCQFGYEGETYFIYKLSKARIQTVLETYGASC